MYSKRTRLLAFVALLLALGGPAASAPTAATSAAAVVPWYYGVYMRGEKIGSYVMKRTEAMLAGKPATRTDATMTLDMAVLGTPARVVTSTVSWNNRTGTPLALEFTSEASGRTTRVKATYEGRQVRYDADIMGTRKSETLFLKDGEKFLSEAGSGGGDTPPQPGRHLKGKVFSPQTLTLLDSDLRVLGREPVILGGQSVSAYKMIDTNPLATSTLWVTEGGEMLRMDSVMGIQIRREPRETALAPKTGKQVDIATAVGIVPTGAAINKPRSLRRGEYELTGLTRPLPLEVDNVQITTLQDGEEAGGSLLSARIIVRAAPLPTAPAAPLFTPGQSVPDALKPYLRATTYIPADDPQFRSLAEKVLGGETDSAKAAAKIAAWVHKTMTPDPSIATLRTAADIVRSPRGVCRDYATLFTAIARAAGLPTKQCIGIAYADGRFLYHAWPEVWVGNDTWVALEPTWGAPFADATHIKLAEGEITDIYALSHDLGTYQVKVLRAE